MFAYVGLSQNLKDLKGVFFIRPWSPFYGRASGWPMYICREYSKPKAFAVKVDTKRLPVFLFFGVDLYQDRYNLLKIRKTGKREVVL